MLVRRAHCRFPDLRPVRWRRCQPGRQRHEARGHGLCHARGRYAGADDRLRQLPPRTFVARTKGGRRYYLYADPDYCKCVFVGDELAMKNYRDLVSPPPQAPMSIVPGKPSVASEMIQEMDPVLGGTIYDGDILDW